MNYEVPEVLEVGKAEELIHGSDKTEQNVLDSPVYRTSIAVVDDVEVLEIGRAEELIHGSDKSEQNHLDEPVYRTSIAVVEDVEC